MGIHRNPYDATRNFPSGELLRSVPPSAPYEVAGRKGKPCTKRCAVPPQCAMMRAGVQRVAAATQRRRSSLISPRVTESVQRATTAADTRQRTERLPLNGRDWMHDGSKGFYEHQPGFLLARVRC